jgi:ATP-dependent exoDNAse (exonuclease V) alpha subunit
VVVLGTDWANNNHAPNRNEQSSSLVNTSPTTTRSRYSVVRLANQRTHKQSIGHHLTGNAGLSAGEHVRVEGRWSQHPKHGLQFQVETCEQILPATVEGIRRYLGSGLIKGVGPRLAERIVSVFGADTLDVIGVTERLQSAGYWLAYI